MILYSVKQNLMRGVVGPHRGNFGTVIVRSAPLSQNEEVEKL